MNKPITIVVEDFKNDMINLINTSKLPLFVVEYILKDLIQDVHSGHLKQLQIDKQKYEQYLQEAAATESMAIAECEKTTPQKVKK